ncbi:MULTISPECIES: adenosylcobinamide-GDP ribazoletransferase [unclassified Agarivorans]|uniref:adenosylcobinamide-GDP ribazoletransferase n=1 Tax=unclassified Agarivorans TaxID=2636026 RepID=UPI003D7E7949
MTIASKITYQWQVLLLAISIFTRLPVPADLPYSEDRKNESYKFSPLVGLLVGCLSALVYSLSAQLWPQSVAVVLSMIASIYMTGAFHEDGFADTCDGFGGGFTPLRKLEIMKDSRVGAYALIGMVLVLLLKYVSLSELHQVPLALMIAHTLSRCVAVSFIYSHGYVRQSEQSKLNIAHSPSRNNDRLVLLLISLLSLSLLPSLGLAVALVGVLLLARFGFGRWLHVQIGGYTGDALGAIQQLSELLCYLFLLYWLS